MSSIITFYSYKSGVGRTMALANIAVILARKGFRVLAVDWDLESSDLDLYFLNQRITINKNSRGLLGLLIAASTASSAGAKPDWRQYLSYLEIDGQHDLSLLTSGRDDKGYIDTLLSLDWNSFFRDSDGGYFIESLREEWREEFDFILIDSRNGVNHSSSICTIQLPDVLVPIFSTNEQCFQITKDMAFYARKAQQQLAFDRMSLLVFPLSSRCNGRTKHIDIRDQLESFATELVPFYNDWLPTQLTPVKILYRTMIPDIDTDQKLPVLIEESPELEGIVNAYSLAATIISKEFRDVNSLISDDSFSLLSEENAEISSPQLVSPKVFISYSHDSEEHVDRIVGFSGRLREEGIDCNIDLYEMSPPQGWVQWMFDQIEESDFVLMVCSETYLRRVTKKEEPGKGKGVTWEGSIITNIAIRFEL